jgi:carboxyl-terminal processing protease
MRLARTVAVMILLAEAGACGGSPSGPSGSNSGPTAGDTYLHAIIVLMQQNSVNRLRIDWTSFANQVTAKAPNAKSIADTYPAIEFALGLLDDHHSLYVKPNSSGVISNPKPLTGCNIPSVPDPDVPQDIGYVRVPTDSGAGDNVQAQNIQSAVKARDRDGLVGWIVDLRGDAGGNMWAMMAGVGPVLGTGTAGYFVEPGFPPSEWSYASGAAMLAGQVLIGINSYTLRRENPRVAVLTDARVTGGGEAIAVAFRGRPGARVFGTPTCGLPTANRGFTLSDNAVLSLTTALMADRQMNVYDSPLMPDEPIQDSSALVARAIAWLRSGS